MKFNEYKYERPNLESKNLKNTYSHLPREPSSAICLIEIKAEVPKDKCKMMSIIAQYKVEE